MKTLLISAAALVTAAVLTPASAQFAVDTPVGGVRIGEPGYRHYRDRDYDGPVVRERRIYRERGVGLNCRTVTISRDDGSMKRIKRHSCPALLMSLDRCLGSRVAPCNPTGSSLEAGVGRHRPENATGAGRSEATTRERFPLVLALTAGGAAPRTQNKKRAYGE